MIDLIILAIVNSFVIIGWNRATEYDVMEATGAIDNKMVFWKLRYYSIKWFGEFWSKPLFTCPTCMASVHSTYIYWLTQPLILHSLAVYPFYVLFLAGLVTFINNHS